MNKMIIMLTTVLILAVGFYVSRIKENPNIVVQLDEKLINKYQSSFSKILMKEKGKELQACYNNFLKTNNPNSEGPFSFVAKLNDDGSVHSLKITNKSIFNNDMVKCVSSIISETNFEPPPVGLNKNIMYTFNFQSEDTAKKEMLKKKEPAFKMIPSH